MVRVDENNIRDLASSPVWDMVMEPLISNEIELWETRLENAETPEDAFANKEVWRALRKLQASINIFKE